MPRLLLDPWKLKGFDPDSAPWRPQWSQQGGATSWSDDDPVLVALRSGPDDFEPLFRGDEELLPGGRISPAAGKASVVSPPRPRFAALGLPTEATRHGRRQPTPPARPPSRASGSALRICPPASSVQPPPPAPRPEPSREQAGLAGGPQDTAQRSQSATPRGVDGWHRVAPCSPSRCGPPAPTPGLLHESTGSTRSHRQPSASGRRPATPRRTCSLSCETRRPKQAGARPTRRRRPSVRLLRD